MQRQVLYVDEIIAALLPYIADQREFHEGPLIDVNSSLACDIYDVLDNIGVPRLAIKALLQEDMEEIDQGPFDTLPCAYCGQIANHLIELHGKEHRLACEYHAHEAKKAGLQITQILAPVPVL